MDIIINGRIGAGKDTVADYLVEKYGYTKIAFADGIYDIAYDYFNMEGKNRQLLQDIGQKMREIDPNVWIKRTNNMYNILKRRGHKVVISDCRQANEYEYFVYNKQFVPLRVSAPVELIIPRVTKRDGKKPDVNDFEKPGEVGADNYDYYELDNGKDFAYLYKQIDMLLQNKQIIERGI